MKEKEAHGSKNEMKSSKFFTKMQEVAKDDAARKEQRRKNKEEGQKGGFNRNYQPPQQIGRAHV